MINLAKQTRQRNFTKSYEYLNFELSRAFHLA